MITVKRYHDICCGHRVVGHEGKCKNLHGHNYRITFEITGAIDGVGRVIDFGVIKKLLCEWLEEHYDHKFLLWEHDPDIEALKKINPDGIVVVPFNPTAENIAQYLCQYVSQIQLRHTGTKVVSVTVEETAKCSAKFSII